MAIEATVQVPDSAVETTGISSITATKTSADPRHGIIYNPTTFAAGVPVFFHRLHDGRYLAIYASRWNEAVGVYHDGPALFTEHEEAGPCYAYLEPATGAIAGPYDLPGLDTLTSAVTYGSYVFTLGLLEGLAVVQHHVITRNGGLQLQGSEVVPNNLGLGLYADGTHLHVFGDDGDGLLTRVRKNWGRIGITRDPNMQWEYQTEKGWSTDPEEASALPGGLPAAGPCSMVKMQERYYLMTTALAEGEYTAQAYTARPVDASWKPHSAPIALGDEDATYMGGSAYLQPQLAVRTDLLPDGARFGFPYVTTVKVFVAAEDEEDPDNEALLTQWGILAV